MRFREFANAQDQLELFKKVVANTWAAIEQEAHEQSKQKQLKKAQASRSTSSIKTKSKAVAPKPIPMPAQPKAQPILPSNQKSKHVQKQINPAGANASSNNGGLKQPNKNIATPISTNSDELDGPGFLHIGQKPTF